MTNEELEAQIYRLKGQVAALKALCSINFNHLFAITQVKNHMDSRSIRTAEQSAFSDASAAWHLPNTYSSHHLQATTTQPFTLLHLFADFS